MTPLLFSQLATTSPDLVFGDDSTPSATTGLTLSAALPPLAASLRLAQPVSAALSATLPGLNATLRLTQPVGLTMAAALPPLAANLQLGQTAAPVHLSLSAGLPPLAAALHITPVGPSVNASLAATLPALAASLQLAQPIDTRLTAALPGLSFAASGLYQSNTQRPTVRRNHSAWQSAGLHNAGTQSRQQDTTRQTPGPQTRWQSAQPQPASAQQPLPYALHATPRQRRQPFQAAAPLGSRAPFSYQDSTRTRQSRITRFQDASQTRQSTHGRYQDHDHNQRSARQSLWAEATRLPGVPLSGHNVNATPFVLPLYPRHQNAIKPPAGLSRLVIPLPPPPEPCYAKTQALRFARLHTGSADLIFICDNDTGGGGTVTPPGTILVPIRRAYIVINDIQLRRVSNNLALPCLSLSLNLDADSWTWGFSASLPASAMADIEPDNPGNPVILEAQINGQAYRLLAENISRDRSFGQARISVTGRGRSAMLADPYSPAVTHRNTIERSAQQLVNDILTVNGVSMGWALDWQVTDWLVPADAFAHQGSYMSAVNSIAQAIGGYVQPDPVLDKLIIKNRYPVAPWAWGSATPDIELPSAAVTKEAISWSDRAPYNGVYVSGTNQGVLAWVKRTGSAGEILAPMVTDPLITHTDAARQRGISILGNTGRIATVSLDLPILPETGIIQPGQLIKYVDGAVECIGLTRSVAVRASLPAVRQTIEVETHA